MEPEVAVVATVAAVVAISPSPLTVNLVTGVPLASELVLIIFKEDNEDDRSAFKCKTDCAIVLDVARTVNTSALALACLIVPPPFTTFNPPAVIVAPAVTMFKPPVCTVAPAYTCKPPALIVPPPAVLTNPAAAVALPVPSTLNMEGALLPASTFMSTNLKAALAARVVFNVNAALLNELVASDACTVKALDPVAVFTIVVPPLTTFNPPEAM